MRRAFFLLATSFAVPLSASAQWQHLGPDIPYDVNDVAVKGNTLVVACETCGTTKNRTGVYSIDGGATWQDLVLAFGERRGYVAVATPSGFVLDTRYLYTGATPAAFQRTDNTFYTYAYQIFREPSSGTLYRVGQEPALLVSTDDGTTWASRPITGTGIVMQGASYVHARGQTVVVGDHWRLSGGALSTDDGATWTSFPNGTYAFIADDGRIYRAGQGKTSNGSVTAALFRTSNGGATWDTLHVAPLRGSFFGQINTQPDPSFIYAEGQKVIYSAADNLYLSTDDGQTWAEANQGLPLEAFGTSAVIRRGVIDGGYLYILRKQRVFSSSVTGYGVYRRPLSELGFAGTVAADDAPRPDAPALSVSPNPATGPVAVAVTLARAVTARIAVYDVLGREVARLHDGALGAGMHRFVWASDAPAGLYFVRCTVDDASVVRTVVRR